MRLFWSLCLIMMSTAGKTLHSQSQTTCIEIPSQGLRLQQSEVFPLSDPLSVSSFHTYLGFLNGSISLAQAVELLPTDSTSVYELTVAALITEAVAVRQRDIASLELALSQFLTARETSELGTSMHHFLSKRVVRLVDFVSDFETARQLATDYAKQVATIDEIFYVLDARNTLGLLLLKANRPQEAVKELAWVLEKDPLNGFALVHTAVALWEQRHSNVLDVVDSTKILDYFLKGLAQDENMHTEHIYESFGAFLQFFNHFDASYQLFTFAVERNFIPSVFYRQKKHVPSYLTSQPFWLASELSSTYQQHVKLLKNNHEVFKSEFEAFLTNGGQSKMDAQTEVSLTGGMWNQVVLWYEGQKTTACQTLFPETCRIVEQISDLNLVFGQVVYSVLAPKTHIRRHIGPTASRLRLHLGIIVPDACSLRVGQGNMSWSEGEVLAFDDAFEHEAWNEAERARVVLVVDLWHPNLKTADRYTSLPLPVPDILDTW